MPPRDGMLQRLRERLSFIRFHLLHTRSRRAIERWQLTRACRMVSHAKENVPIYQELYARLDPSDLVDLHALSALPIITKRVFFGRDVEDYTNNADFLRGSWATTSGTSGEPFTLLTRADFWKPFYAESIIYRTFIGTHLWKFLSKPRIVRIMTKSPPQKNRLFINISEVREYPKKAIERIAAFKPEIIESFASILYTIAETVEKEQLSLRVPYAISGGERLSDGLREYVSRVLGCEIYNRYGMEEFTVLAMECAKHDGMHTNAESYIVEIVDADGNPLPDGAYGRIIVTDLYNEGMPFIRYDTGDHGTITRDRCACGRSTPRVWIEGRYSASLSFADRKIHHLEFDAALETFMNVILQYQVVKKSETNLTVVVIPGKAFDAASAELIVTNIRALVGEHVSVSLERVQHIPAVPRGKSRIVQDLTT